MLFVFLHIIYYLIIHVYCVWNKKGISFIILVEFITIFFCYLDPQRCFKSSTCQSLKSLKRATLARAVQGVDSSPTLPSSPSAAGEDVQELNAMCCRICSQQIFWTNMISFEKRELSKKKYIHNIFEGNIIHLKLFIDFCLFMFISVYFLLFFIYLQKTLWIHLSKK